MPEKQEPVGVGPGADYQVVPPFIHALTADDQSPFPDILLEVIRQLFLFSRRAVDIHHIFQQGKEAFTVYLVFLHQRDSR